MLVHSLFGIVTKNYYSEGLCRREHDVFALFLFVQYGVLFIALILVCYCVGGYEGWRGVAFSLFVYLVLVVAGVCKLTELRYHLLTIALVIIVFIIRSHHFDIPPFFFCCSCLLVFFDF